MSKGSLGRWLRIGAIMVGVAAIPSLLVAAYIGYRLFVPRYTAVVDFDRLGFNLRLDFYQNAADPADSGRYLTVIRGSASHTVMLPGWDWAHWARTNVYRIDDNHIAVLGPRGNDGELTLNPFAVAPVVSDPGEQWQYLGAFEFTFPPGQRPRLQFFDTNLAECIPMGTNDPGDWSGRPRPQARRATCATQTTE